MGGIIENRLVFKKLNLTNIKEDSEDSKKISGMVAQKGIVRGKARILLSPKEQGSFSKGEILVTSMTTPDFLPAMEKTAAFVTDEGGITCHAAIIAREMKKPCIIGTKNASKILKNGSLVEVNASKGVVEIINKK